MVLILIVISEHHASLYVLQILGQTAQMAGCIWLARSHFWSYSNHRYQCQYYILNMGSGFIEKLLKLTNGCFTIYIVSLIVGCSSTEIPTINSLHRCRKGKTELASPLRWSLDSTLVSWTTTVRFLSPSLGLINTSNWAEVSVERCST